MRPSKAILTVGHSTHEADEFAGLLQGHGVELLVDVRRHPGSRRVPWTARETLARHLADSGIDYLHLEGLGGRRRPGPDSPNGGWRVDQFQGYADHMESDEFRAALALLEERAEEQLTAVMCAEAQWWRCHRRLLADALTVRGWRVAHIDPRGGLADHVLTDFAQVRDGRLVYPPLGSPS